jgi:hypothetical protein
LRGADNLAHALAIDSADVFYGHPVKGITPDSYSSNGPAPGFPQGLPKTHFGVQGVHAFLTFRYSQGQHQRADPVKNNTGAFTAGDL